MERMTQKVLEAKVKNLNHITKKKYSLYRAYGKNQLVIRDDRTGGIDTVSTLDSKRELAEKIDTLIKFKHLEELVE